MVTSRKRLKGKKIMKKMILLAVALFSMTATFAADENTTAATAVEAYNLTNVNMESLSKALSLNIHQEDAIKDIHKNFSADLMDAAATSNNSDRKEIIDKAIKNDLKYVRSVLTDSQYRKYLVLLNTTLNNRGINK